MRLKPFHWAFLDRLCPRIVARCKLEIAPDSVPPVNVRELASSKGVFVTEARIDGKPFVHLTDGITALWLEGGPWRWAKAVTLLKSGVFDD